MAFLVLLERLAPDERAAFLLHEVFDCSYADIAAALGKSEGACRQVVHRARERVQHDRKRFAATEAARVRLLRRFVAAVEAQDERAVLDLLAPDAAWVADGGGQAPAAPQPILGAERIAKLVLGLQRRFLRAGVSLHLAEINGETGLVVRVGGAIGSAMAVSTDGVRIFAVHAVLNPSKLSQPVSPFV